jgi:hypothetical protein
MALSTTSFEIGFGSGVFFITRNDIADGTPYQIAALQDITISFNGELKDLFSQGQYPIAVARGKVKIEGKGKMALVSTPVWNSLFFGGTVNTGQTLTAFAETHNIAATITSSNAATFTFDLGVYAPSTGERFTLVDFTSGTLSAGTYKVNPTSGVYNFFTGDVPASPSSLPVQISYQYTAAGGFTLTSGNPFMGTTPTFRGDFYQPFENYSLVLTLYACVATSISIPDGGVDNFLISDFAFGAFQAPSGNVFTLSTTQ